MGKGLTTFGGGGGGGNPQQDGWGGSAKETHGVNGGLEKRVSAVGRKEGGRAGSPY